MEKRLWDYPFKNVKLKTVQALQMAVAKFPSPTTGVIVVDNNNNDDDD